MALIKGGNFAPKIALIIATNYTFLHVLALIMNCDLSSSYFIVNSFNCYVTSAFMGPVGGFCYFCFEWVVHGPSVGNLLRYCLRALLWEYVMALINYDHSEAACGECVTWCVT